MSEPLPKAAFQSYSILKKFAYLFSAHWVREGLQTAFLIYLARTSTSTYGQFMLAISIGQILLFIAEFGLNQHLATLLARRANYPSSILAQVTLVKTALLLFAWLGMIGFIFQQGYDPALKWLIIVISTGVGLEALASSFFVACQVLGRQDVEGKMRTWGALAGFGYGLGALALGAQPIVTSFFKLVETVVFSIGAVVVAFQKYLKAGMKVGWRDLPVIWTTWRGGITYTLMAVAAIFYNKINMFFLQKYGGSPGVAQYSATWQIVDGVAIMISGVLLRRVLFPLFVKLWITNKDEFHRLARISSVWLLAMAMPVMFVLFIESDRLIPLVYGKDYADAAWMQRWLVGTILFAFLHNQAAYLMVAVKKERLLLVFYLLGLALNLALCAVLIPWDPLLGTSLAILLTKGLVACITVGYCQVSLRMIPGKPFALLCLACAAGAGLYWLGLTYVCREVGEAAALVPIVYQAWRWRKKLDTLTLKAA